MKTIAISGWLAYVPFRVAKQTLNGLGVEVVDGAHDRIEGLRAGRYAAAPMSTYHLVEALALLGNDFAVSWVCAEPVGFGSDRIVVRNSIKSTNDLHRARIGLSLQGLEVNLLEHLFETAKLPPKKDYVILIDRSAYGLAFCNAFVDAVMAPQPNRSQLLNAVSGSRVFDDDRALPRFGLYAPLVCRRNAWDRSLLDRVQEIVSSTAAKLAALDNDQLRKAHASSFEGIDSPADEVRETLHWLTPAESNKYLHGTGTASFMDHLQAVASFRTRRFGAAEMSQEHLASLVIQQ